MSINKKIVFEIFALVFLVMSAVPVCGQSDFGSPDVRQKGFSFYAVYDRLADTDSLEGQIWCSAMSGDGNRLIFSTTTDTFLYTVNTDGSDLTSIPLPADLIGIGGVTIDYDGSRAFFMARDAGWINLIYKVEGGVATQILDTNDHSEIGRCTGIETTADGEYVYFTEDRGSDLWRIQHGGGTPEKVIEDTEVPREEGSQSHGRKVKDFAISADGSTIAFVLYGYVDPTDGYRFKEELFVLDGDGYRQLTNDDKNVYKSHFDISGDGTTIVFWASVPQNKWYSIRSDGSAKIALEAGSGGDLALNYDGTRMFYTDSKANGGRLVNTDGSDGIDLFPSWSAGAIMIAATFDLCIRDDGRRVSFRYISGGGPLYVGYLNDPDAVPDSSTIHNIVFDPPAMPRGDPDARVIVTSEISDPQGLADIERTSIDELVDGRLESGSSNVPVYFYLGYYGGTRDEGDWPDETAGDGIFSNAGRPGGKIDELDQMTVRMGAMDASKTVVVADKVLSIGGVIPTPTPTRTSTEFSGKGDCNGDGKITDADARCALQMAVGKRVEDLVMDVNGDGKVSSIDARKILRTAAGLEVLP